MPGMPMPGAAAGAAGFSSGLSATSVSVVRTIDHVNILVLECVEANAVASLLDVFNNDRALEASIVGNLADRLFDSTANDVYADFLIAFSLDFIQCRQDVDEGRAATCDDTFRRHLRRYLPQQLHA